VRLVASGLADFPADSHNQRRPLRQQKRRLTSMYDVKGRFYPSHYIMQITKPQAFVGLWFCVLL